MSSGVKFLAWFITIGLLAQAILSSVVFGSIKANPNVDKSTNEYKASMGSLITGWVLLLLGAVLSFMLSKQ